MSEGSQVEEHVDKTIELDGAASSPGCLALDWVATTFLLVELVDLGGWSVGVVDEGFLRK